MAVLFTSTVATRLRKADGLQRWARYAGRHDHDRARRAAGAGSKLRDTTMDLALLTAMNEERAARRAAILVTDIAVRRAAPRARGGDRRRSAGRPADGAAARRQERHGGDAGRAGVPHRAGPAGADPRDGRGAHQPGAGADGEAAGARRDRRRPPHRLRDAGALSRRRTARRVAGRGAAAPRRGPLHRLRGADARSQDRRSRADPRPALRLLLHRRARLAEDACRAAWSG